MCLEKGPQTTDKKHDSLQQAQLLMHQRRVESIPPAMESPFNLVLKNGVRNLIQKLL
jgi:hypothetical protein